MARLFSAREANQHFSEILGRATDGETVIITRLRRSAIYRLGGGLAPSLRRDFRWGVKFSTVTRFMSADGSF